MTTEVRYYSKQGNTKRVAEAIANQVGVQAKPIDQPVDGEVDILFLGGAIYAFGIDPELTAFIQTLDKEKIKKVAIFSTAAIAKSAYDKIKAVLDQRGISVSDKEFHCPGEFKFLRKGRPNATDLGNAAAFAKELFTAEV